MEAKIKLGRRVHCTNSPNAYVVADYPELLRGLLTLRSFIIHESPHTGSIRHTSIASPNLVHFQGSCQDGQASKVR